ncbi:14397_t:CDS:2, partial [Rhizophagus irregularis]
LKKLQEYQVNEDDSDIKSQVNEYDDKIKLNRTSAIQSTLFSEGH